MSSTDGLAVKFENQVSELSLKVAHQILNREGVFSLEISEGSFHDSVKGVLIKYIEGVFEIKFVVLNFVFGSVAESMLVEFVTPEFCVRGGVAGPFYVHFGEKVRGVFNNFYVRAAVTVADLLAVWETRPETVHWEVVLGEVLHFVFALSRVKAEGV